MLEMLLGKRRLLRLNLPCWASGLYLYIGITLSDCNIAQRRSLFKAANCTKSTGIASYKTQNPLPQPWHRHPKFGILNMLGQPKSAGSTFFYWSFLARIVAPPPKMWYDTLADEKENIRLILRNECKYMQRYRSGHNGADSKSWSLSGSLLSENPWFYGVFRVI